MRPLVETAVIEGIVPGRSTVEELNQLWGEPPEESVDDDQVVRCYSMPPLNHIIVTLRGGIVRSIVINLETPFREDEVRASLHEELLRSKPVLIPDETGGIIGEIFPEKGVMFIFAPQTAQSRGLLVQQIGIEPVSAEPFVLRAEALLHTLPSEAKLDLRDAIRLKSDHARANWLLAQIELLEGNVESALLCNEKAIQLDEQKPAYHLTFAQALTQMNRIEEAKQYLQETIAICDRFPHEKAKALMMLGDLSRTSLNPDHVLAYECHEEAIRLATALLNHSNQTVRLTAKDVLFEAHLATARAIAWGRWDKKERLKMWIDRAKVLARDPELVAAPRYSRDYKFKIAACALATLVDVPETLNIDVYLEDVIDAGNELIQSTEDPIHRAKFHWDTGISLYDAVQIFQRRQQYATALRYGELATKYMETGIKNRNNETDLFLMGRLYYRLGTFHAVGMNNHRAAIEWYDLAKPIYERLLPKIDVGALEIFGRALVSMGCSYWETDQREEAVRLTERGARQLERGVRERVVDESELGTPYTNLVRMYRELGNQKEAAKYTRLAAPYSDDKVIR
jgi:tetratricopeptide (TPR) repeat protein